jgi:hypothetical protein
MRFAPDCFACCGSLCCVQRGCVGGASDADKYLREWRDVKNFRMQNLEATNRKSCAFETQLVMTSVRWPRRRWSARALRRAVRDKGQRDLEQGVG